MTLLAESRILVASEQGQLEHREKRRATPRRSISGCLVSSQQCPWGAKRPSLPPSASARGGCCARREREHAGSAKQDADRTGPGPSTRPVMGH